MSPERESRTTILALGDDRTDEDLFAALPPDAISARVGPGATRARFRLEGTSAVRGVLQLVADAGVRADLA
jgi:trehalose 6-phosphate synthase/phosphatase